MSTKFVIAVAAVHHYPFADEEKKSPNWLLHTPAVLCSAAVYSKNDCVCVLNEITECYFFRIIAIIYYRKFFVPLDYLCVEWMCCNANALTQQRQEEAGGRRSILSNTSLLVSCASFELLFKLTQMSVLSLTASLFLTSSHSICSIIW